MTGFGGGPGERPIRGSFPFSTLRVRMTAVVVQANASTGSHSCAYPRRYPKDEVFVMATADSPVMLPEHVLRAAEVQARLHGVTVDQWVSRAVVERLDTDEGAREYFRRRAAGATGEALRAALDAVPDNPPEPGDER